MATDEHDEINAEHVRNPEVHHERRTFNTTGVLLFMAFLIVFGVLVHFTVWGLMKVYSKAAPTMRTAENPAMAAPPSVSPPPPVLQPDPVADLHRMRAQEDQILQGYAWVDQGAGKVRIPIARAMQLLVERGLPSVNATTPSATTQAAPKQGAGAGK